MNDIETVKTFYHKSKMIDTIDALLPGAAISVGAIKRTKSEARK